MADAEMHAIQIHNPPVFLQAALTPRFKLLGKRLIEATDGTGTGGDSHQGLSDFSHGCRVLTPATNICVRLIARYAVHSAGSVELAFAVSGHPEIFESTRRCRQI